mmetsp:Transcript_15182/g.42508  ORF Transcript_15182/g.42508 Transcript_15182/m.42508 type:complete len:248 (-) Transcript_15182:313-1056(-)
MVVMGGGRVQKGAPHGSSGRGEGLHLGQLGAIPFPLLPLSLSSAVQCLWEGAVHEGPPSLGLGLPEKRHGLGGGRVTHVEQHVGVLAEGLGARHLCDLGVVAEVPALVLRLDKGDVVAVGGAVHVVKVDQDAVQRVHLRLTIYGALGPQLGKVQGGWVGHLLVELAEAADGEALEGEDEDVGGSLNERGLNGMHLVPTAVTLVLVEAIELLLGAVQLQRIHQARHMARDLEVHAHHGLKVLRRVATL